MKAPTNLTHEFIESFPDKLEQGKLYVSVEFATAAHLCVCGCGHEVITPLSPADWQLLFDGESISLRPSIGNWSFDCQSHYWIEKNKVRWAPQWTRQEIESGRSNDRRALNEYYDTSVPEAEAPPEIPEPTKVIPESLFGKVLTWLSGLLHR